MIRILLAEDQAMVRGALSALLGLEPDIEVLGSAADGEAAWRMLQQLQPDILVTDIEMPGLSGLELAQRIARHELPIKVVIVTTFARTGFLRRALEAGVLGYLLKDAPAENLADALAADPVRLKALRGQCAADRQAVGEDACRAAAEAFRRRFFAGHTGPDEYNSLAELPPIPPSFDTPADELPEGAVPLTPPEDSP